MGLLDQIEGALSEHGATGGGLPAAIHELLSSPQSGGLTGFVERFATAGLGPTIQSWIGNGPNQSISPQDVHKALGDGQVQQLSDRTGMSAAQLLPLLAKSLPTIIDRLTPNGQVPAEAKG